MKSNRAWLALAMAAVLMAAPAMAADKPNKEARRMQQQLHAAEMEKAKLGQQVAEAEGQIREAKDKSAEAERRADAAAGRSARLTKELDALKAEKEAQAAAAADEQTKLKAKLAETERKLAELQMAKQQLDAAFASEKTALAGCRERNDKMYRLGNELLDSYDKKGCTTSLLQAEPFTGLKRAQIEKMIEADRAKLDQEQILAPATGDTPGRAR